MKEANNAINKMSKEDLKENVMQQFKVHFLTIGLGLMLISDENGKKEIINSTADKFDGELKALGFNPPESMVACLLMAAIARAGRRDRENLFQNGGIIVIGKNIKKALTAKIEDWLKYVDDTEIVKILRENIIITGGCIVSMLNGEEVHDYDVYFRTKEACQKVAEYYAKKFNDTHCSEVKIEDRDDRIQCFIRSEGIAKDEEFEEEQESNGISDETEPYAESPTINDDKPKYRPVFFSTNAISLSDKIQLVIRFYGSPEEIHKNYDFVHCTCCYSFFDNELTLPSRALESIINKELYYIGSKYPVCSIIRTRKFISRGWTINAGQYLKMCLQVGELNLKDFKTFKDQLAGVDSAYFSQAIACMEKKAEEDSNFKIDNTYLFEVINRIF
ncbi:hypothetical protein P0092_09170 [Ruminiclostridium papyrosolvens DSM 2782]|nr:hypothetical protein [Ruminiclostridium papyrosolvens]WES36018.1 hypothetical protein P0092_08670 [Ruminiclostridium papyrosolvens DSM 2782]WES36116.1 hypothetical protein P0092_09170 [Ruminiclostridium papyrosolvens DSM 2782]